MIKLLVIDDEKGLCAYLKEFFSLRGYEVYTASSGQEALNIVKANSPELVLLDINMPEMNGLEILRRIKKESSHTKVVMVTVNDDNDTKEKAKSLGADEFIKKPFTTDYLEDAVILKVSQIIKEKESPNILIVDDEEGIRDSLNKFLKTRFECNAFEAESAEAALDLLKKNKFDLIFLDIKMPGTSGTEVLKAKKKLDYNPYIVVVTHFDSEEIAHKVIKQGADDYISKPFSLRVLNTKVRDILSRIGKYKPISSGDSGK